MVKVGVFRSLDRLAVGVSEVSLGSIGAPDCGREFKSESLTLGGERET